jgi:PAS domain-containing protein
MGCNVDLNGVITFINSVACGLSGLKQDKSVGELIEDVLKYAMEKRTNKCKPLMQAMLETIR